MPRRLKVPTNEMGDLELYLIYEESGIWELEWRPLQGERSLDLPVVSKEHMDQALTGWTRPLVETIGRPPKGMLIKLPIETRKCASRARCPFHRPSDCGHLLAKMPWCYEPEGVDAGARLLMTEVIKLWREGVYVVLVREGP